MQNMETTINGIDTNGLKEVMKEVLQLPEKGKVGFQVSTRWQGGTRTEAQVEGFEIGGDHVARKFTIPSDEPFELLGGNTAPNPQELLMAALNACMAVGYVTGCATKGIELESLEIDTQGELDLRGFLNLSESVKPGYEQIVQTVRIKGSGTPEQFLEVHKAVLATSPNYWNVTQPIRVRPRLVVE